MKDRLRNTKRGVVVRLLNDEGKEEGAPLVVSSFQIKGINPETRTPRLGDVYLEELRCGMDQMGTNTKNLDPDTQVEIKGEYEYPKLR